MQTQKYSLQILRFGGLFLNCGLETDRTKHGTTIRKRTMKRLIIDSKKMTPEIMALVKEKYPEGYYEDDIIVFKNHKNETIEAIQVETSDTVYLIKIGKYLSVGLENFEMEVEADPQVKPGEIDETEEEEEEYDQPEIDEDDPEEENEDSESNESDDQDEDDDEIPVVKNTKKK